MAAGLIAMVFVFILLSVVGALVRRDGHILVHPDGRSGHSHIGWTLHG